MRRPRSSAAKNQGWAYNDDIHNVVSGKPPPEDVEIHIREVDSSSDDSDSRPRDLKRKEVKALK